MVYDKTPVALLAVFPTDRVGSVREVLRRLDVPAERIHVEDEHDIRAALRAEQVEEARESLVSPQAVPLTKEPSKALTLTLPIAGLVGALIAAPFALIPVDGLTFGARLIWYCIIGALGAGTIAYIVTTAMAAKDSFEPNAAQRGAVMRIDDVRPDIEQALEAAHPIRLDRLDEDGTVLATVVTEEDREEGGIIEEVEANVHREHEADPTDRHR